MEGNEIRSNRQGILVEGDAKGWMESSPIRDALITKNTFINCGIDISANVKDMKPEEPIHENFRIIDNIFDNGAIHAYGTKGLTITHNISKNNPLSISLHKSCTKTKVENNVVKK